jgi:polysaccharide deacetylase 2 family uncharacterized protein YibQ
VPTQSKGGTKVKRSPGKKNPSKRKKKRTMGFWSFLLLMGLLLVLGFVVIHLFRPPERIQDQLDQKIGLIDKTITSRLFELGFSKEDILSRQSLPQKRDRLAWTTSTIKVQLPQRISFSHVEQDMKRELTRLDDDIRLRVTDLPSKPKRIDVRVEDLLTHNIIFYPPKVVEIPKPRVAIVIDDLGSSRKRARNLMEINANLTLSFLPYARNSRQLAREAFEKGKEVILHMPMEPHEYPRKNPGKGALLMSMTDTELQQQIKENLDAVPCISGVNNHMGSCFMEDTHRVKILMEELKERRLFFLDSRTTPETTGYGTAKKMGMRTGQRDVFLDNNSDDEESIRKNIQKLAQIAQAEGIAVGIGHPHPSTIKSLREMIPALQKDGIEFVSLSDIMK